MVSYTCELCCQTVQNKVIGHCVGLVQIIRYLEGLFDLGQNRVLKPLEQKADILRIIEDLFILIESCENFLHICEKLLEWHGSLIIIYKQCTKRLCFFDPPRLFTFYPIVI